MKDLQTVKKFIDDLVQEYHRSSTEEKRQKKIKKELPYYKMMANYIESNPTKDYLNKEVDRINGRLKLINDMFEPNENITRKQNSVALATHNKTWNVKQLKSQLKAVKYILS